MQILEIDLDDQVSKVQLLSNDPFKWRCFFLAILLPFLSSAQIVVSNEKGKPIVFGLCIWDLNRFSRAYRQ